MSNERRFYTVLYLVCAVRKIKGTMRIHAESYMKAKHRAVTFFNVSLKSITDVI